MLTDCPFLDCGLPSELRESFSYGTEVRVVVVCPRNHVVGAGADELEWLDFFESPPSELLGDIDPTDGDWH